MSVTQPLPISPGATLDISWDWSDWLTEGETIASYDVVPVAPMTVGADSQAAGIVTAMVSAPAMGEVALEFALLVRCTVTTSAGRTDTRRFRLVLTDR